MQTRWWLVLFAGWTLLLIEAAPFLMRPSRELVFSIPFPASVKSSDGKAIPPVIITNVQSVSKLDWTRTPKAERWVISCGNQSIQWPPTAGQFLMSTPYISSQPALSGTAGTGVVCLFKIRDETIAVPFTDQSAAALAKSD